MCSYTWQKIRHTPSIYDVLSPAHVVLCKLVVMTATHVLCVNILEYGRRYVWQPTSKSQYRMPSRTKVYGSNSNQWSMLLEIIHKFLHPTNPSSHTHPTNLHTAMLHAYWDSTMSRDSPLWSTLPSALPPLEFQQETHRTSKLSDTDNKRENMVKLSTSGPSLNRGDLTIEVQEHATQKLWSCDSEMQAPVSPGHSSIEASK